METARLKIEHPCPVALLAMKKEGDNYHCRYCGKTVIDFRKMPDHELKATMVPGICGIFNSDQLPAQQRPHLSMRLRLAALAVFSVLGFHVRVSAQTGNQQSPPPAAQKQLVKRPGKDSLPVCPRGSEAQKQPVAPAPKKKIYRTVGCPSF